MARNSKIKNQGAFIQSIYRNNETIKKDRAELILKSAKKAFSRYVEDLSEHIETKKIDLESMLDMSPDSADSLVLAKNFNSKEFVEKYCAKSVEIYNKELALERIKEDYKYLFGE